MLEHHPQKMCLQTFFVFSYYFGQPILVIQKFGDCTGNPCMILWSHLENFQGNAEPGNWLNKTVGF